ncbi:MAG: class I SAM-dependent methyltransferase [Bryobacteraceae bacterium]
MFRTEMPGVNIPLPPLSLRGLVSPITDDSYYDNATGDYIWGPLDLGPLAPGQAYRRVVDFGCGCGREARRLLLQRDPPESYVGIDINREMIAWCRKNLRHKGFSFYHHDVWNVRWAPDNSKNRHLPIAHLSSGATLIEANSVFTHLHDDQARFYLEQMRLMLDPDGIIRGTWFFFNQKCFPAMTEDQHTIFVSEADTTAAVYYDWSYFVSMTRRIGFRIVRTEWSPILGFHNSIYMAKSDRFADLGDTVPPGTSVLGF